MPVSVAGTPKSAEAYQAIQVQEGQTLDEIAADYQIQPNILQELNPDLGNQPRSLN